MSLLPIEADTKEVRLRATAMVKRFIKRSLPAPFLRLEGCGYLVLDPFALDRMLGQDEDHLVPQPNGNVNFVEDFCGRPGTEYCSFASYSQSRFWTGITDAPTKHAVSAPRLFFAWERALKVEGEVWLDVVTRLWPEPEKGGKGKRSKILEGLEGNQAKVFGGPR